MITVSIIHILTQNWVGKFNIVEFCPQLYWSSRNVCACWSVPQVSTKILTQPCIEFIPWIQRCDDPAGGVEFRWGRHDSCCSKVRRCQKEFRFYGHHRIVWITWTGGSSCIAYSEVRSAITSVAWYRSNCVFEQYCREQCHWYASHASSDDYDHIEA